MIKTCLALSPTKANFAPLLFAGDMFLGMETAAQLGYEGVELNLLDSTQLDQNAIQNNLHKLGLQVPSIGTGQSYFHENLSLADPCPEIQAAVRARMRSHIEFASRLGAAVVIGSIRGKLDTSSPEEYQKNYDIAVDAVRDLASFAKTLGASLTVEPINRYETNFLNTIEETLKFIQIVGCHNVGLVADTFHMNIEEKDMAASFLEASSLLWHVHFADSNRYAVGLGHLDFQTFVTVLQDVDYKGFVSAEIIPVPDSYKATKIWIETIRPMIKAQQEKEKI
jgi:sugar phosphate isomerase/epimerase